VSNNEIYLENLGRELAQSVIERSKRFGRDAFSEEAHDLHEFHDGTTQEPSCVHCATYRYHMSGGRGHVAALMQLAQFCIDNDGFYRAPRQPVHN
jgi:hypothetical protein